jgi:hypothetical protein
VPRLDGPALRRALDRRGMSTTDFAAAGGWGRDNQPMVSYWITQSPVVRPATLKRIAETLHRIPELPEAEELIRGEEVV